MKFLKIIPAFLLITAIGFAGRTHEVNPPVKYDIVIYGGTSAGIAAAIQGARSGKTCC